MLDTLYEKQGVAMNFCEFDEETSNEGIPRQEEGDKSNCPESLKLAGITGTNMEHFLCLGTVKKTFFSFKILCCKSHTFCVKATVLFLVDTPM